MQNSLQIVETLETLATIVPAPVELTAEELQQVGGGVTTIIEGPHDSW